MAKARIQVICSDCGAAIWKETTKSSRSECNSWESWAKAQDWQCPTCWGKAQREAEIARGLIIDVKIIGNIGLMHSKPDHTIRLSFAGDTMPHKEAIKALGYRWGDLEDGGVLGLLSAKRPKKAWQLYTTPANTEAEIKKAISIGASIGAMPTAIEVALAEAMLNAANKIEADKSAKEIR